MFGGLSITSGQNVLSPSVDVSAPGHCASSSVSTVKDGDGALCPAHMENLCQEEHRRLFKEFKTFRFNNRV